MIDLFFKWKQHIWHLFDLEKKKQQVNHFVNKTCYESVVMNALCLLTTLSNKVLMVQYEIPEYYVSKTNTRSFTCHLILADTLKDLKYAKSLRRTLFKSSIVVLVQNQLPFNDSKVLVIENDIFKVYVIKLLFEIEKKIIKRFLYCYLSFFLFIMSKCEIRFKPFKFIDSRNLLCEVIIMVRQKRL